MLLASPVYRASFTGALKNLLDLTPVEALRAKPVGIVAMGATRRITTWAWTGTSARCSPGSARWWRRPASISSRATSRTASSPTRPTAGLGDLVGALLAMAGYPRDQAGPPPLAAGRG